MKRINLYIWRVRVSPVFIKIVGCLMGVLLSVSASAQHRSLRNIAGIGSQGLSGDSGLAIEAEIGASWGIVEDNDDNIYFADLSNGRIRRIDAQTGEITTIAGTTPFGSFNGDGILATTASLGLPAGIDILSNGDIVFSDLLQHRIRKIDMNTGYITTIAGTGTSGHSGDGGPGVLGNLSAPTQVYVDDNDNIYFADVGNFCIRKLDYWGYLSTVAGTPGFSGPSLPGSVAITTSIYPKGGLTLDENGNIYFGTENNKIMKINATTGMLELVAGTGSAGFSGDNGPATNAKLNEPYGLRVHAGVLYFADRANFRIRQIELSSGTIKTVVGTGVGAYNGNYLPVLQSNIDPFDVMVRDDGTMLITDNGNYFIRQAYDCYNPDKPLLSVSSLEACPGDTVEIKILAGDLNDGGDWVWRTGCLAGDSLFAGPTFYFVMDNDNYTVHVRGEGKCANNIECSFATIIANCNDYHNAFSPNNDGLNDYWIIPVLDYYPENEVTIFNRWGDEIMYIQNYNNTDRYWMGDSYGAEEVPAGTYYFTVTSPAGLRMNGWVQVVK